MKVWKITFKDGTSQQANNYHHLTHGGQEYLIKESIITKKETIEGKLWWKKIINRPEEELHTILVILKENVLKIELVDAEDAK